MSAVTGNRFATLVALTRGHLAAGLLLPLGAVSPGGPAATARASGSGMLWAVIGMIPVSLLSPL